MSIKDGTVNSQHGFASYSLEQLLDVGDPLYITHRERGKLLNFYMELYNLPKEVRQHPDYAEPVRTLTLALDQREPRADQTSVGIFVTNVGQVDYLRQLGAAHPALSLDDQLMRKLYSLQHRAQDLDDEFAEAAGFNAIEDGMCVVMGTSLQYPLDRLLCWHQPAMQIDPRERYDLLRFYRALFRLPAEAQKQHQNELRALTWRTHLRTMHTHSLVPLPQDIDVATFVALVTIVDEIRLVVSPHTGVMLHPTLHRKLWELRARADEVLYFYRRQQISIPTNAARPRRTLMA